MNALSRYADTVFCLMRLVIGLLFACHGGQKILGFPSSGQPSHSLDTLGAVGAWIELVGGFAVALGLLTRIAAFVLSGEMAVAYFMVHFSADKFFPIQNHGESAVIYCWIFIFMFFYGPGRWSIDAMIGKGRTGAATS